MANVTGRPIAPARKLVAAVLGTIAVFVMVFGLGMTSWAIVALGAAMLALAIALSMVNVVRRGARAWVAGTAQVKAISPAPSSTAYGRAELQIMVIAPGLPISEVLVRDPRVPVQKWPNIGDTLPVTVDVDDMRRVRITWAEAADTGADGDPPPPSSYDTTPESPGPGGYDATAYDPEDFTDDDLLGDDPEPPPWRTRDRQWGLGPDEPPAPAAAPGPAEAFAAAGGPVVVRETAAGPILEGQLVNPDEALPPLPQRARSASAPASETDPGLDINSTFGSAYSAPAASGGVTTEEAGVTTEDPPPPPSERRPSPRPRRPESPVTASDPDETSGDTHDTWAEAAPPPRPPGPAPAPGQRQPSDATSEDADATAQAQPSEAEPADATAEARIPEPRTAEAPPSPSPTQVNPAPATPAAAPVPVPEADDPEIDVPLDGDDPPARPNRGPWADLDGGFEPDQHPEELLTAYPSARPGASGAIHGVGATVAVIDLPASVAFYRDLLGFFEVDTGAGSAVLASGETRLVLRTAEQGIRGRSHLNLEVGDVEAVYRELTRKGVEFEHGPRPVSRGDRLELWAASFHDPDGHDIDITQWRAAG